MSVLKSLQEVQNRFPDGIPLLDPIDDMGIKDKGLKEVVKVCISVIAAEIIYLFISVNPREFLL